MSTPEPPPYPGDSNAGASGDLPSYGSVPPPPGGGDSGSVPPPPPPPPPAPPSYGGPQAFAAPDAIAWGWRKFKENMGPVIVAVLAIFGISVVLGILSAALTGGFSQPAPVPGEFEFSPATPLELVAQIVQSVISLVLTGVAAKAALEVTEGKPFDFFGAFGRINVVNLILASIIVSVLVFLGFILLIIPGIIMLFLTYLTTYSVVDDGKSAVEAVKHSIKLVSSNVGGALLLALLNFLVMVAGFFALCVGLIVAIPITVFATAYAYRTFNGQAVAP